MGSFEISLKIKEIVLASIKTMRGQPKEKLTKQTRNKQTTEIHTEKSPQFCSNQI